MTEQEENELINNIIKEFKGYEMIGGFVHKKDWYDLAEDLVKLFTLHDVVKPLPNDIEVGKAMSELSNLADKEAER